MIRHTCDKCGKDINATEPRFEARVEAGPVCEEHPDLFEDFDFGEESLTEMMERLDRDAWQDNTGGSFRFDLCEACYAEFVDSPLLKGARARSGFRR